MKKINYKKLAIWGISFILIITTIITLVIFLISNNNKDNETQTTSADISQTKIENIVIPNVTKENTIFKISDTKNNVESVSISATNRLSEYNLYYYLKFNDNSKITNEDYLIFNDLLLILDENCTICFKYELDGNFSNENYEIKISNIKIPKKESKKATEKELKEEKVDKKDSTQATSPYFIKVNYGANTVTIYKKDKDGKYTVPYKAMVCSCGTYTPTSGTYKTSNKYTWRLLIDNVYGQYATRIVGSILFHSVPYVSNNKDTLEYWEYDKLGQTASAGCVRLTVRDAKWIYNNCPRGTMVEFYSSSTPGPLGKPSAQKISSNIECRDWDPTDPATENPWHTYKPEDTQQNNTTTNNTITNSINTSTNQTTNTTVPENTNTSNTVINNSTDTNITNNMSNNTNTNNTLNNNNILNNNNSNNNNTSNSNNNLNNLNNDIKNITNSNNLNNKNNINNILNITNQNHITK